LYKAAEGAHTLFLVYHTKMINYACTHMCMHTHA